MPWAVAGAVGGALIASDASRSASNTQADAASNATAANNAQYQQTRQDNLPLLDARNTSLGQMVSGAAPGGDYNRDFSLADFRQDPGYQFRLAQGQQGVEQSAAARGGALSGGALKGLVQFNQGTADQAYGDAYQRFNADRDRRFNRLASIAGLGQTATAQTQALGGQSVARSGEYGLQGANAQAAGTMGQANAWGGLGNSLANLGQQRGWFGGNNGSGFSLGGMGGIGSSGGYSLGNGAYNGGGYSLGNGAYNGGGYSLSGNNPYGGL
jgi:hypothetical protein